MKKVWILSLSMVIVMLLFVVGYKAYSAKNIPVVSWPANHEVFDNEPKLLEYSDLVVIGHVEQDFEDANHVFDYEEGDLNWYVFYSLMPLKVDQVLYGTYEDECLTLLQPAAIEKREDGTRVKYVIDNYQELEKNKLYILYMGRITDTYQERFGGNLYGPVSIYFGVFNLTDLDADSRVAHLVKGVLSRFGKTAEEVTGLDLVSEME